MAQHSYDGPALDMSWQHIQERPGKTVEATPDTQDAVTTTVDAGTELASEIVETAMRNPNAPVREIAARVGCDPSYAWRVMTRQSDVQRYRKDQWDDLSDRASKIVWIRATSPDRSQRSIAEQVGVSEAYVSKIIRSNDHLVDQARDELAEVDHA